MPDAKAKTKHAKAQRKYAAKLRQKRAPRSDDLARAMLKAARTCLGRNPVEGPRAAWELVLTATLDKLATDGFDRQESERRLFRALGLDQT